MAEAALSGAEFKKQLRGGQPKMGLFLNAHSPTLAEQLSFSGYDWLLVARKGAAGQKGDIGPQGPAGTSNVFVSAQTYTIPRTGTLVIMDRQVNPNSFITLLYVGPCSNVLPPFASRIERGQFTVGGVPGKQFRYVVFN